MKMNLHHLVCLLLFGLITYSAGQNEAKQNDVYRLKVNDELLLSTYGEEDMSGLLTVDRQGKVTIPMVKKAIQFAGLTRAEAAELVRQAYADGFLRYPIVDLKIAKYSQDFVQVSGQVMNPGPVPIPFHGELDLSTALTNRGWVTLFADNDDIKVIKANGTKTTFSLSEIQGAKGKTLLGSGDQVVVSKSRFANLAVSVEGEVVSPGPISFPKDGKLDFKTVMVRSGGPTVEADRSKVELIPANGGKSSFFSYDAIISGKFGTRRLNGGDRILVWKSPFTNASVIVSGAVNRPGAVKFSIDGKFTLMSAIDAAGGFSDVAKQTKIEISRVGYKPTMYSMPELKKSGAVVWLQPGDRIKVFERIF